LINLVCLQIALKGRSRAREAADIEKLMEFPSGKQRLGRSPDRAKLAR
jgi:hypothetical protein